MPITNITRPLQEINLQSFLEIQTAGQTGKDHFYTKIDNAGKLIWHLNESYLKQEYGGIISSNARNIYYEFQAQIPIQDGIFKTSEWKAKLPKITADQLMVHRRSPWFQTGYQIYRWDKRTSDQWYEFIKYQEISMARNYLWFTHATALDIIITTCLATGNFKVFKGITTVLKDTTPAKAEIEQNALAVDYQTKRLKQVLEYRKRHISSLNLGQGSLDNMIECIPEFEVSLLAAAQQVSSANLAFQAGLAGQVQMWNGFKYRTSVLLGNNNFTSVAEVGVKAHTETENSIQINASKTGMLNQTSQNFDFSNVAGLFFTPGSLQLYTEEPVDGRFMDPSKMYSWDYEDGDRAYRSHNFTIEGWVKPGWENTNMLILSEAPTEPVIAKAQKRLADMYGSLYVGFTNKDGAAATNTNVATGKGLASYTDIIACAKSYYLPSPISNPFGMDKVNFSGIIVPTKA